MYAPVVNHLCREFPDSDIFFVAMRHIAGTNAPAPSPRELAACLQRMLLNEMFEKAHFIGHSFGSTTLSWVARYCPSVIAKLTFIDPICFYVTKGLRWAMQNTMTQHGLISEAVWFFAMSEIWTSHVLRRNFFWHDTVLWPDTLRPVPTLVILNGADHIVPALSVQLLLQAEARRRRQEQAPAEGAEHEVLEVVMFNDMPHGAFLMFPSMMEKTFSPVRDHHERVPARASAAQRSSAELELNRRSVDVAEPGLLKRNFSEQCLSPKLADSSSGSPWSSASPPDRAASAPDPPG